MSDIVQQLRDRAYSSKIVDRLCEQAADEIDLLRSRPCPYVTGSVTQYCTLTPLTLTDAEREAVEAAAADDVSDAQVYDAEYSEELRARAATLRGLLERLG